MACQADMAGSIREINTLQVFHTYENNEILFGDAQACIEKDAHCDA